MGVTVIKENETDGPLAQVGQKVTIHYTGWVKDTSKPDNKGSK